MKNFQKWKGEIMKKMFIHYIGHKQTVLVTKDKYVFFSYNSAVAEYSLKTKKLILSEKWNYSRTTLKYLSVFFENYDILHGKGEIGKGFKESVEDLIKSKSIKLLKERI